jgi:hypothetical protein
MLRDGFLLCRPPSLKPLAEASGMNKSEFPYSERAGQITQTIDWLHEFYKYQARNREAMEEEQVGVALEALFCDDDDTTDDEYDNDLCIRSSRRACNLLPVSRRGFETSAKTVTSTEAVTEGCLE